MAIVFEYTRHSKQRLKERGIESPEGKILCSAGKKTKRKIRESCLNRGVDQNCIYLIERQNKNPMVVYVCSQLDIGKFLLITAFKYSALMKVHKFYNETFDINLELVVFKHDKGKECKKLLKYLTDGYLDYSDAVDNIDNSDAFCIHFHTKNLVSIIVNEKNFAKNKKGSIEIIKVLAHECNHFRECVLVNRIAEIVTKTDLEAHLRISDWAFKKCMSTKFFKSLLK